MSKDKNGYNIKPLRVLSLDGGGMRGLYTASVLNSLMRRFSQKDDTPLDIGKGFDLITGTSTGAILACGLAAGIPISKIIDLYRNNGLSIFRSPVPNSKLRFAWWVLKNCFSPANENKILQNTLINIFGDRTIGSIYDERGIGLCINSINIANHGPRVFKTPHIPEKHADNNRKIVDICLATSAAPIIFPIASIPDPEDEMIKECFIDGGLWANNPILVALIEALEMSEPKQPIEIISIGTCPPPSGEAILEKNTKKGLFYWKAGINALELSMDAQASGYNFMATFIGDSFTKLGKKIRIYRLKQSPPSAEHSNYLSLDNASEKACSTLIQLGSQDGKETYGEIIRANSDISALKYIFENLPLIR